MTMTNEQALEWAHKAFSDGRNEQIDRYAAYIDGKHPIAFATDKFRKTFGNTFDSFAYNRMGSVIDAHSDRLQITGLSANETSLAQMAQEQWDANRMDVRENESTNDALSYGDGFIIVEADATRPNTVHYWVNDPRTIRVHYSDTVPGELDLAAKRWVGEDELPRLNIYFPDRVEKYVGRNKNSMVQNADAWEYLEDESFTFAVSDTVPVFHLGNQARTNQYGKSEIQLLIPLQDAVNFVLMSSMVATEFSAFAQKVIMGVQPETDEEKQQFAQFEAGMDRILMLFDENSKIGEFSASDLSKYIELAEFWDTTVSRVSRVPIHYLKSTGTGNASGETFRMMEAPFTAKITDRQRSFGYVYSEVATYGQRLLGRNIEPGAIRVNWQDAAPHSEFEMWELAEIKQRAGMPFRAVLREAGYEPEQLEAILEEWEMERLQAQRWLDRGGLALDFGAEEETA